MSSPPKSDKASAPLRVLGVFDATMLVIGSVIGAGIFLVGGFVAESVGSAGGYLGVWLLGGLFALSGALCNGELGAMFPRGGGGDVYLRAGVGAGVGFRSGGGGGGRVCRGGGGSMCTSGPRSGRGLVSCRGGRAFGSAFRAPSRRWP